jgi:plastocyanin
MFLRFTAAAVLLSLSTILAGCSSSPSSPSSGPAPAPAGSTTVTIPSGASTLTTTAYSPNPVTISTGTTISWLNNDTTTHTSTADGGQFSSGSIAPGARFNFTFTSTGQFTYHCQIHPGMVGTIIVQ